MKMTRFDISARNPVRAMAFYKDVFGWDFQQVLFGSRSYWKITNGPPGIDCGMTKRDENASGGGYTCIFEVDSVDEWEKKIAAAGGGVLMPKIAMPGTGWLLICKDTEGNAFGLQDNDKSAHTADPLFE